jgi:hypothetical protein
MSFFLFIVAQVPEFPVGSIPATGQDTALADFLRNNMQYVIILAFLWSAIYVSKMGALSGSQAIVGKMGAALGAGLGVASGGAARGSAWLARKAETKAGQMKGTGLGARAGRNLLRGGALAATAGTLVNKDVRKAALEEYQKKQADKLGSAKAHGADIGAAAAFKKGDKEN